HFVLRTQLRTKGSSHGGTCECPKCRLGRPGQGTGSSRGGQRGPRQRGRCDRQVPEEAALHDVGADPGIWLSARGHLGTLAGGRNRCMGGWRRYLELKAQAKIGLSSGLFVWALLAVVFGVLTAGFVLLIAFIWLAERYDVLTAAIALAGLFLLATIIAAISCLWSRRRTIEQAELALGARRNALWLDPKVRAAQFK